MLEEATSTDGESRERKWRPLSSIERRVFGVLIEKAKTTPDNYPITLNSLTSGCNQKSNRDPQMSLEPHQVEDGLETLRRDNAVAEVQGDGRVAKYRHFAYDWLGVDKNELAIMGELLLRGAQTLGELRGRAARMGDIPDVGALKPMVDSLIRKELVVALTPEGRGQVVTHNLHTPEQLAKIRAEFASAGGGAISSPSVSPTNSPSRTVAQDDQIGRKSLDESELSSLRSEVQTLKSEVARLKSEIEDIWSNLNG